MQEPNVNKNASWKELFFKEAFFLYEHREAIYSDERMFCTPLPFENNLAYSGNYGLDNATLGVIWSGGTAVNGLFSKNETK